MPAPIAIRLNDDIPEERALRERYDKLPRARRGEWLRRVFFAGVAAIDREDGGAGAQAPARGSRPPPAPRVAQAALVSPPAPGPAAPVNGSDDGVSNADGIPLRGFFDQ